jgi:hypothetical protein
MTDREFEEEVGAALRKSYDQDERFCSGCLGCVLAVLFGLIGVLHLIYC